MTLPVAAPLVGNAMLRDRACGNQILLAVADAAVVLAPIHLGGVRSEIWASNFVVDADFRATQAGEKRLRLIGVRLGRRIRLAMIDLLREVPGMKRVPMRRFVGENGRTKRDALLQTGNASIFRLGDEG